MEGFVKVLYPFKVVTEILGGDKYVTLLMPGQVFISLLTSL